MKLLHDIILICVTIYCQSGARACRPTTCAYVYTCVCIYIYTHKHTYIHLYVNTCVCIHIYIYIERERLYIYIVYIYIYALYVYTRVPAEPMKWRPRARAVVIYRNWNYILYWNIYIYIQNVYII